MSDDNGTERDLSFTWEMEHGRRGDKLAEFATNLMLSTVSGEDDNGETLKDIFEALCETRSDEHPEFVMRVTINGVEVDAGGFIRTLERNFDWYVANGVKDKLTELRFYELDGIVDTMQHLIIEECKSRMRAAGMEIPHEEEWE